MPVLKLAAAALLAAAIFAPAHAQTPAFPTKPVRITSPFPTGLAATVEAGGPAGFEVETWTGIVAPRGTPPDVVGRLSSSIAASLKEPEVRERFRGLGFQPVSTTSAEMAALTRKELARFRDLVKRIGITAE